MKQKSLVLTILLALSLPAVAGGNNKSPIRSISSYSLVAHLNITDDNGRLLVWKATLKGEINGFMLWWFNPDGPPDLVHEDFVVKFYSARWDIFDEDPLPPDGTGGLASNPDANLLMAGVSAGQTLIPLDPPGADGIWDGNGIVTETSREYRQWRGCITFEGGPVVFSSFPYYRVGKIRINPHGFRPADLLNKPAANASEENNVAKEGQLKNYPNPFNPSTTIEFDLKNATQVRIEIYNTAGQKVKTLLNEEMQAGNYKVGWNAAGMASGVYFYKLQTNQGFSQTKRLILLK